MIIISIKHLENIIELAKKNSANDNNVSEKIIIREKSDGGIKVTQLCYDGKDKLIGY